MKHGHIVNTIRARCARPEGCSLREAAEAVDRPLNGASVYLSEHLKAELTKAGCHGEYRYFTDKQAAEDFHAVAVVKRAEKLKESKARKNAMRAQKEREKRAEYRLANPLPQKEPKQAKKKRATTALRPSGLTIGSDRKEAKREHQKATIIWPDHVQVQRAPTPRDDRFTFTPPPGWKGQITQDWLNRRLEAA